MKIRKGRGDSKLNSVSRFKKNTILPQRPVEINFAFTTYLTNACFACAFFNCLLIIDMVGGIKKKTSLDIQDVGVQ